MPDRHERQGRLQLLSSSKQEGPGSTYAVSIHCKPLLTIPKLSCQPVPDLGTFNHLLVLFSASSTGQVRHNRQRLAHYGELSQPGHEEFSDCGQEALPPNTNGAIYKIIGLHISKCHSCERQRETQGWLQIKERGVAGRSGSHL